MNITQVIIKEHFMDALVRLEKEHDARPGATCSRNMRDLAAIAPSENKARIEAVLKHPKVEQLQTAMPFVLSKKLDKAFLSDFLASMLAIILDSKDTSISTIPTSVELIIYPDASARFIITWSHIQSES